MAAKSTALSRPRTRGVSKAKFFKLEAGKKALQRRYKALKEGGAGVSSVATSAALTASGGAAAGAVAAVQPDIYGVPTPLIIGSVLLAYAAFGGDSKFGGYASCIGQGMLAKCVGDWTEKGLETGEWSVMHTGITA